MPKSRARNKQKHRGSRYQLEPQRKRRAKTSPRWYGPLMLVLIGIGVIAIVWNYTRGDQASNTLQVFGGGLIALGLLGSLLWK